jgi:hypothetical protein
LIKKAAFLKDEEVHYRYSNGRKIPDFSFGATPVFTGMTLHV